MARKKNNILHVRSYIEWIVTYTRYVLDDDKSGRRPIAPFDRGALAEINLIGRAILKKHAAKNTRKDIYVERKS